MSDHPSTFRGETGDTGTTAWDDRASLHAADDSGGVLDGGSALQRGTFAEMIRHLAALPQETRQRYVIAKAGDRRYSADEAMALASRPDFPAQDAG
ncbi:hypothetical protein OIK40_02270 [Erythrobacter sp. sf7]|uniref:Uncharacterized protein n=1 Tax=Erythrobacter fulvus TaxID=2987523 RepID=A0ABT5JLU5_9SPHN|nr:hypothetical protein [Erythrobacter fulvus]MDC8753464.1 hypothetical protein [Erythrobacter fulvus]